jgi:hypothetical protein
MREKEVLGGRGWHEIDRTGNAEIKEWGEFSQASAFGGWAAANHKRRISGVGVDHNHSQLAELPVDPCTIPRPRTPHYGDTKLTSKGSDGADTTLPRCRQRRTPKMYAAYCRCPVVPSKPARP